jgi:hypothetical protein
MKTKEEKYQMKRSVPIKLFSLSLLLSALFTGLFALGASTPALAHTTVVQTTATTTQQKASADTPSFDARPCLAQPSPATCEGILPVGPDYALTNLHGGSGACFDGTQFSLGQQNILDPTTGKTVGVYQFWFLPDCGTYTLHIHDEQPGIAIDAEVDRLHVSDWLDQLSSGFAHLIGINSEDIPVSLDAQETTVASATDIWTPMLYSPTAPVQATALIGQGNAFSAPNQRLITNFFAAGKPTTVNGKSS